MHNEVFCNLTFYQYLIIEQKETSARIPSSSPEQARAIAETTFEESFIITDVSGIKHLSLNHSIATSSPKTICRRKVDDLFRFDIVSN